MPRASADVYLPIPATRVEELLRDRPPRWGSWSVRPEGEGTRLVRWLPFVIGHPWARFVLTVPVRSVLSRLAARDCARVAQACS